LNFSTIKWVVQEKNATSNRLMLGADEGRKLAMKRGHE
jgi:hypothetical protein